MTEATGEAIWVRRWIAEWVIFNYLIGNSDAHVLEGIGTGFTTFAGHTATDYRAALLAPEGFPQDESERAHAVPVVHSGR